MSIWLFFGFFQIIGLLLAVFWIWMLVDAIKYQEEDKVMWVLLVAILNFVGALVYFLVAKSTRKASQK